MAGLTYLLPSQPIEDVEQYLRAGGGEGLRTARMMGPQTTMDEVADSGLRGRGGSGFPTARKWASVRDAGSGTVYVVANAAEGEPATFKDRSLIRRDPYRIVEGLAIAALAVGATEAFIATKRSFTRELGRLREAVDALTDIGLLEGLRVTVVEGPGEYLFGEEKALLEVVEGRDPLPRLLPPWQHGLFATVPIGWEAGSRSDDFPVSNPTLVNNVETLASVAHILARGALWFRSMGTVDSPGTLLVTVVGAVTHPGVMEVEMGTALDDVLGMCGGPLPDRRLVAALSGVSNQVLLAAEFDVPLTYEDMAARGTSLGAAGFAIYDDSADMVSVTREFSRFLAVESCGQCPACKSGSMAITERLAAIDDGRGTDADLGAIAASLRTVTDANRCYLGTEELNVVSSMLRAFPEAFAQRIEGVTGSSGAVLIPLVVDIADDGTVTYDERHATKLPDWTYVPSDPTR